MDLRSIINNEGSDGSKSKQAAPVTPVHAHPPQSFRDYTHLPHRSPGTHPSPDLGGQTGATYIYQQGSYQGRPPPPPPIQAPPQNDWRSPARSFSAQSPYQHTPSSATSQYPFPVNHPTPQSPAHQAREHHPLQQQNSFSQGSPHPQTPPIGIPGAAHPYLQHQRSHSSVSISTPTSAQSQQQFFHQYQDSVGGNFPNAPPQRQQSQPGTPLGPPLTQRNFPQPSSPFQQRGPSSASISHSQQTSPTAPAPASIPRLPSTPSGYDSQRTSVSEQHRSHSEREQSLSVSPKTRLPSLPGDGPAKSENGHINTIKRRMDDQTLVSDDTRSMETKAIEGRNGDAQIPCSSPHEPPKKRTRYTEPPIWAQSIRTHGSYTALNQGPSKVNGKQSVLAHLVKMEVNGGAPPAPPNGHPSKLLGNWEQSITGKKPLEQMTKIVADFLFLNVVSRNDNGELASRGVQVEIEAKLGELIDKDTNQRIHIPVISECVLADLARVGFKSTMTELQHQRLNKFLNDKVAETHPNNPNAARRVKIDYLHRRETDRFYELPKSLQIHLPAAVRERLLSHHAVKVRVTHDQKNGNILAKIIKARVADLDIYSGVGTGLGNGLDCRISINLEMQYEGDLDELIASASRSGQSPDRNKDRLSYTQSHYQIDLTQVTQTTSVNNFNRTEKEHELEIEISTDAVMDQGQRAANSQPNEYLPLIEGLLDNVRVLSRFVAEQGR